MTAPSELGSHHRPEDSSPHQRFNPLLGEWDVLVSPHRSQRPTQWQEQARHEEILPPYDKDCFICPGNTRANGKKNPEYADTWVFSNDFSALHPESLDGFGKNGHSPFFRNQPVTGICEVLCYSPRHDHTMANMPVSQIEKTVRLWQDRYTALGSRPDIAHVQLFENRGKEVGASLPHPHGQVWAQADVPLVPAKEARQQRVYYETYGHPMLIEYAEQERRREERVVDENEYFVTVVPYWAKWPYETLILPKQHNTGVDQLTPAEVTALGKSLFVLTRAYASLSMRPLYGAPYTMGIHQRPTDGREHPEAQMHIHFELPLLTPTKQKHVIGYERFAQNQRDITPERAAHQLKQEVEALKRSVIKPAPSPTSGVYAVV